MQRWADKEVSFLKDSYNQMSYIEISKKLHRSLKAVYWKAFELKLNKGRWNESNKLTKQKIVNLLVEQQDRLGMSPSVRLLPISIKSACQRHFGNLNNAKKIAGLKFKEHVNPLHDVARKPSKELAYIIGLLIGDGSFRYQKSSDRTSYVIFFATKDKDLMDYFVENFKNWSGYEPRISIRKDGYRKFPNGITSYFHQVYFTQIGFKNAWVLLKHFYDEPLRVLDFFHKDHHKWILKGLWDAEGSIRKDRFGITFSNGNNKVISLYTTLLYEHGFKYSIHKSTNVFNIDISNENNVIGFVRLIDGITIKRKVNNLILKGLNNEGLAKRVYTLVKEIPKGRVSTYKDIAQKLNTRGYRAVGQVLKINPYPFLIPCHRVVSFTGNIGGFKGKKTVKKIQEKINLLREEGIKIENNRVVDFEKVLYLF